MWLRRLVTSLLRDYTTRITKQAKGAVGAHFKIHQILLAPPDGGGLGIAQQATLVLSDKATTAGQSASCGYDELPVSKEKVMGRGRRG